MLKAKDKSKIGVSLRSINKITVIGLTCMAAIGTSMIIMECTSKESVNSQESKLNKPKSVGKVILSSKTTKK